MGEKDWMGKWLYGDFQIFRYTRDLTTIATKGLAPYLAGRQNLLMSAALALAENKDPVTGLRIYDESAGFMKNLPRYIKFLVEEEWPIGFGKMVGTESGNVGGLRTLEWLGGQLSTVENKELTELKKKKSALTFEDEQAIAEKKFTPTQNLSNLQDRERNVTAQRLRNEQNKRSDALRYFFRNNRSVIRRMEE
jgi:hypothetical protein